MPLGRCVRDDKVPFILAHWWYRSEPDLWIDHIVLRSYFFGLEEVLELRLSFTHTLLGSLFVRVFSLGCAQCSQCLCAVVEGAWRVGRPPMPCLQPLKYQVLILFHSVQGAQRSDVLTRACLQLKVIEIRWLVVRILGIKDNPFALFDMRSS